MPKAHSAESLALALGLKRVGNAWRGSCPVHGGSKNPFSAREGKDFPQLYCFAGCSWESIRDSLMARGLWSHQPPVTKTRNPPRREPGQTSAAAPAPSKSLASERHAYPQRLWQSTSPIPVDQNHPARRWMTARNLVPWLAETPPALRFAKTSRGSAIVALAAPLKAWIDAWPALPKPAGVQCIFVDAQGQPTQHKRSYGRMQGSVVCIGNPHLPDVHLAEGLADALALAYRLPGFAFATLGTSGMRAENLAAGLKGKHPRIWPDNDDAGRNAAENLQQTLRDPFDIASKLVFLPENSKAKDPASYAQTLPFPTLDAQGVDILEERAAILEFDHDLPHWEAERCAVQRILFGGTYVPS